MQREGEDVIPLSNLDLGVGEGVCWDNVVRLVRVIQKNGLSEEARFCLKTRFKTNTAFLVLNTLAVVHTIAINSSLEIRKELSQQKWFKYIERSISQPVHSACITAVVQILVDWEALFSADELGRKSSQLLSKIRGVQRPQISDGATAKREEWDAGMPSVITVQQSPDFGLLENTSNRVDQQNVYMDRSSASYTSHQSSHLSPHSYSYQNSPSSSIRNASSGRSQAGEGGMLNPEETIRSIMWLSQNLETKIQNLRSLIQSGDRQLMELCMDEGNKLASDGQSFKAMVQDAVTGPLPENMLARLLEANDGLACLIEAWSEEVAKTFQDQTQQQQQQQTQPSERQTTASDNPRTQPLSRHQSQPSLDNSLSHTTSISLSPYSHIQSQPQPEPQTPMPPGIDDLLGLNIVENIQQQQLDQQPQLTQNQIIYTTEFVSDWIGDPIVTNPFIGELQPSLIGNPFDVPSGTKNQIDSNIQQYENRIQELEQRVHELETQLTHVKNSSAEEIRQIKSTALSKIKDLSQQNQSLRQSLETIQGQKLQLNQVDFSVLDLQQEGGQGQWDIRVQGQNVFQAQGWDILRRVKSEDLAIYLARQPAFNVRFSQQYLQDVLMRVEKGQIVQRQDI